MKQQSVNKCRVYNSSVIFDILIFNIMQTRFCDRDIIGPPDKASRSPNKCSGVAAVPCVTERASLCEPVIVYVTSNERGVR